MTSPSKTLDDVRNVGLLNVPNGSFLITGRPRMRSAWLAGLMSFAYTIYHEAPLAAKPIQSDVPFGLIDPGAACLYPIKAMSEFLGQRIVIIERHAKDARKSLERLVGQQVTHWDELEKRYQFFKRESDALVVPFEHLTDFETVFALVEYCTGAQLSRQHFDLFDGLRIEQDFKKAQQREASAA